MIDERLPRHMAGEQETLIVTLEYLRRSLLRNLDGLDDSQARASTVPSGTSVLGLIHHLTFAETYWIVDVFEGGDVELDRVGAWDPAGDSISDVVHGYEQAAARTSAVGSAGDLEMLSVRPGSDGDPVTLRWILVHLIEEIARHAGHADIIREQLDGVTGR